MLSSSSPKEKEKYRNICVKLRKEVVRRIELNKKPANQVKAKRNVQRKPAARKPRSIGKPIANRPGRQQSSSIITVLASLLIFAAAGAFLYLKTDLFKEKPTEIIASSTDPSIEKLKVEKEPEVMVSTFVNTKKNLPLKAKDYSYAYWPNGLRKIGGDKTKDILCFETGYYGFSLDLKDLSKPGFGVLNDNADVVQCLDSGDSRMKNLPTAELDVILEVNGKKYKMLNCEGNDKAGRNLGKARMWESGTVAQHFDIRSLVFKDESGKELSCSGKLDIVGWPENLTFSVELSPEQSYADGPVEGIVGSGLCIITKPFDIPHKKSIDPEKFTLESWVKVPQKFPDNTGWLFCKGYHEHADGNFGFMYNGGSPTAVMNIGQHEQNTYRIGMKQKLFKKDDWNHLVVSYDGKDMKAYLNGKLQGIKSINKRRTPGQQLLRVSKRGDGQSKTMKALYDQIRIWDRPLSDKEIRSHAENPAKLASRNGLVLEENFDTEYAIDDQAWKDAKMRISLKTGTQEWIQEKQVEGSWNIGEKQALTLNCNLNEKTVDSANISVGVSSVKGQKFQTHFNPEFNSFVAEVKWLHRSFYGGYIKITDYDELSIVIDNSGNKEQLVPFLLDLRGTVNITGLVPFLCHPDGKPTGIPVQLSKNWHYKPMGEYLRAYSLIPAKPGRNSYLLRISYGFYGTLPSASHAQLSLVGYGGRKGRWDQLALACGGESITFDIEMSCVENVICDFRVPLGRDGVKGNPWSWTDATWGGDWLRVFDNNKKKLPLVGMKTAYLSHGPCLSDVMYKGAYGSGKDVLVDARIMNPRTDDYARTCQELKYTFMKKLSAKHGGHFMEKTYAVNKNATAEARKVFIGNGNGLITEVDVTDNSKGGATLPPTELKGPGPWWITVPGNTAIGYIAPVIRKFDSTFAGINYPNPFVVVDSGTQGDTIKVYVKIVPPPGVDSYQPGDTVKMDMQWLHLVPVVDNYGGFNESYRKHLKKNTRSWKTTYREVTGNDLKIDVAGGKLLKKYPIVIKADAPEIDVEIVGGVGCVPIRFEGLKSPEAYTLFQIVNGREVKLDQSVHGNDFWQTDYDAASDTYKMTYNLPLDELTTSKWVLKPQLNTAISTPAQPPPSSKGKIEAENDANLLHGRAKIGSFSEGSHAENLDQPGDGIEFTRIAASSTIIIHYAALEAGTHTIYVNNEEVLRPSYKSTGSWTTHQDKVIKLKIPDGASVRFAAQNGDKGINIDHVTFK